MITKARFVAVDKNTRRINYKVLLVAILHVIFNSIFLS